MKTAPTAQDLFRNTRQEWLDECRIIARNLLKTRQTITIEDVLKECPRPKYLRPNIVGSVFHDKDFVPVGYTMARKPSSHSRVIRVWSLSTRERVEI